MGQAHFSSQYTTSNDLTTYSYTRTNGRGATESRITCKNSKDGVVTSLLTFSDGHGKCFTQEWGPHLGDEAGAGDNTEATGPPCDGFNCDDYSYLPNGWTEALIMTGYGKAVGNGLATVMRGGPALKYSAGSFRDCNSMGLSSSCCPTPCNTGCAPLQPVSSCCGGSSPYVGGGVSGISSGAAPKSSSIELKPLGAQV
jgi:hypothetical protein